VASSGSPPKYSSSTSRNTGSSGAAVMNSVIDERSFIASTSPKIAAAGFPSMAASIRAHSTKRGPSTGCAT
jgi:hypothetical protein